MTHDGAGSARFLWQSHFAARLLLGDAARAMVSDPIFAPLMGGHHVPRTATAPEPMITPLPGGGGLVALADDGQSAAADTAIAAFAANLDELRALQTAASWAQDPALMVVHEFQTATADAADPTPSTDRSMPLPSFPGLVVCGANEGLAQSAARIGADLQTEKLDVLDALRAMCADSRIVHSVGLSRTGSLTLRLQPLACLRGCTRQEALMAAHQGAVLLHRDRPRTVRLPVLAGPRSRAEIVLRGRDRGALSTIKVTGGLVTHKTVLLSGDVSVGVQASARPGQAMDVRLAGHHLAVHAIALTLPHKSAADLQDWADPLSSYGDPLTLYEAKR